MQQLPLGMRLRERARFANFIPGDNRACVTALRGLASRAAEVHLLHGPAASGKTHLLLATLAESQSRGQRCQYLPLRELYPLGAEALGIAADVALLCADDIDTVAADAAFCRALFRLWRQLEEQGGTLLLAMRAPPATVNWALPDLGSRVSGLSQWWALAPLTEAEHGAVLQQMAAARGIELPLETQNFLLQRLPRDLHRLAAAFEQLDAAALVAQRRLTVPFVREVLERL